MIVFSIGAVALLLVLGLFYLKDVLYRPWLTRLVYSEFTMRFTVFAVAMMLVGALLLIGDFWSAAATR